MVNGGSGPRAFREDGSGGGASIVRGLRVYVVEDDDDLRAGFVSGLGRLGFAAAGFGSAVELYRRFLIAPCDIVLLDVHLPDAEAFEMAVHLREGVGESVGVVMLSEALDDRLRGFHNGADYYLLKSIDLCELAAILAALGRRVLREKPPAPELPRIQINRWRLARDGWTLLSPDDIPLSLSLPASRFLGRLLTSPGKAVSKTDLVLALGEDPYDYDLHRLEVMVSRLRRRAQEKGLTLPLRAVRGIGYVWVSGSDPDAAADVADAACA
ncbi:MAG TPA: response regulator transcription factor [Burkholderiales bacterium]|nr:response regulator transcription factor [Burkholderiales bacterium]